MQYVSFLMETPALFGIILLFLQSAKNFGNMEETVEMNQIRQYDEYVGAVNRHPLVSVIDFSRLPPIRFVRTRKLYGFYAVYLRDAKFSELKYGRGIYEYQEGSLVFVAPGQIMGSEPDGEYHQMKGHVLLFHQDLLRNTALEHLTEDYTFFSYTANEALYLSKPERGTVLDCFKKINDELSSPDELSDSLIVDCIKLLLGYCTRFYNRQFSSRKEENHDVLVRFDAFLSGYLHSDALRQKGMPTVQDCADALSLSPAYLGDLIKKETGISALKHIHRKMLELAKENLWNTSYSINQISDKLGFLYPQHFNRWFKKMEGCTPNQYRNRIQSS